MNPSNSKKLGRAVRIYYHLSLTLSYLSVLPAVLVLYAIGVNDNSAPSFSVSMGLLWSVCAIIAMKFKNLAWRCKRVFVKIVRPHLKFSEIIPRKYG